MGLRKAQVQLRDMCAWVQEQGQSAQGVPSCSTSSSTAWVGAGSSTLRQQTTTSRSGSRQAAYLAQ
jgi:hypothetical protein